MIYPIRCRRDDGRPDGATGQTAQWTQCTNASERWSHAPSCSVEASWS